MPGQYQFILVCSVYRGHTVRAVTESFQLAKDAGFKVVAHMMPDLPNVGLERDVEQFIVSISATFLINVEFSTNWKFSVSLI